MKYRLKLAANDDADVFPPWNPQGDPFHLVDIDSRPEVLMGCRLRG